MPMYNLLEYCDNYSMEVCGIIIEMMQMMMRIKMKMLITTG